MFENFKRMVTPRNIQILFAIIGVFILIAVLKMYNLYEGLENQTAATNAAAPTAVATPSTPVAAPPAAVAAPPATNAAAPPAAVAAAPTAVGAPPAAVDAPAQITKTTGPSTNNPIIS